MNDHHDPQPDAHHEAHASPAERHVEVLPPFDPAKAERRFTLDATVRIGVGVLVALVIMLALLAPQPTNTAIAIVPLAVLFAWIALGIISARAARRLPVLMDLVENDPNAAEAAIAEALRSWPLARTVRLLLLHRLAALRHRQGRYPEVAAICSFILDRPLTGLGGVQAHLLLMQAEALLAQRHVAAAYPALRQLHRLPKLSLPQQLQRLALQTRYEVLAGYSPQALAQLDHKIALAELMPGAQCGLMHAMLAAAATYADQPNRARWLTQRAVLLCPPALLTQLATEGLWPHHHPLDTTA